MIKVELINKAEVRNFYRNWGEFSCVCYNTNPKYAERVGKSCEESEHYSGSRCEHFKFKISGISRVTTAQLNRHSVGVVVNEKSMRYCDFSKANVVIPPMIASDPYARNIFEDLVEQTKRGYGILQAYFKQKGFSNEKINEDVRYILPIGIETEAVYGFTLEALINFMEKRLCTRSQWEIRQVANLMRKAVLEVLPELKDELVPACKRNLFCTEDKCCGLYPKKSEVLELVKKLIEKKREEQEDKNN